jgi:predicted transposase YbfD/YdcC
MNKKQAPHIRKLKGNHPKPDLKLIRVLENIEDPRRASCNFEHPLVTILFITIVCSLCGADEWEIIVVQARAMAPWLAKFVDVSNGIPSVRTFKRVFESLNPQQLENILREVADLWREKRAGDVISFDGKTMRGTSAIEQGLKAIHMLNAWSHDNGICIGHRKADDKSNEITALPQLMEVLDLTGTIITADALNTQKEVATKAIACGADYLLPVKGNHPTLLEELQLLFKDAQQKQFRGFDADEYTTIEKAHGRIESRKYYSIDASELPSAAEWASLRSAGMVARERTIGEKTSVEVQYYISSCEIDAKLLEKVARGHWGIETSLHWVLDVVFREDKLRYRERIGAQNLSAVRKLVLGALAKDTTLKCGKAGKRLTAATNPQYREIILKKLF